MPRYISFHGYFDKNYITMKATISKVLFVLGLFVVSFCHGQDVNTLIESFNIPTASEQGSAVTFTCTCRISGYYLGIPITEVNIIQAWRKNGKLFAIKGELSSDLNITDTEIEYSMFNSLTHSTVESSVLFRRVQVSDSGLYECGLYNSDPKSNAPIMTREGNFNVRYFPVANPVCQPVSLRYTSGSPRKVNLTCAAEIGNPRVTLTWFNLKDAGRSSSLSDSEELQGDVIISQLILDTTRHDENSMFTCEMASPEYDITRSCSVKVSVIWPFTVSIQPNEIVAPVGDTAAFHCKINNNYEQQSSNEDTLKTEVQWTTEPREINSSRTSIFDSTFHITKVEEEDNGTIVICYVLFDDRWYKSSAVLYTTQLNTDPSIMRGPEANSSQSSVAWMSAFFVVGGMFIVLFVLLAVVCFKYRNVRRKYMTSLTHASVNLEPIRNDTPKEEHEYRDLRLEQSKQGAFPSTYTDLKTGQATAQPAKDSGLEYTYVDESNGQKIVNNENEEVYDYADAEITRVEQPLYINRP